VSRGLASLSLDLDNQWSYMRTHGDAGWESYPSYLDVVVPRVLRILRERDLVITFFVVGQDAAREENRASIASLSRAGHEIGNHSFRHEPWFHLYAEAEIDAELARTEDVLESVTGVRPVGFRGPGFTLSESTLRVLHRRGYRYDCSTFPTFLGPLARTYYFLTAKLTEEEKRERKLLFGTWSEGLRPLNPYRWSIDGGTIPEIPVTTLPILRVPIHVSYVLYLSMISPALARAYFTFALELCRWTGTEPSILLHPLDFLGGDDVKELAFFPAMSLPGEVKAARTASYLDAFAKRWQIVSMGAYAEALEGRSLRERPPRFPRAHDLQRPPSSAGVSR
jgi:peptidoglycan/xylan/chitin deacetylase (PgdA/CDA1 family)